MKFNAITVVLLAVVVSGCGLTTAQKSQVGQFATATKAVSISTQEQFISMREKVIEMEKRRLIMRNEPPKNDYDLDAGLSASALNTQINTLKALQAYAELLNKLVENSQSEAIKKAANNFMQQYEKAKQLSDESYQLDAEKQSAISGVVDNANAWFIEAKKKSAIKRIVKSYSKSINELAALVKNDLVLTNYSLCLPQPRKKVQEVKVGVIDIYCTSADALRELSLAEINKNNSSFYEREFNFNSYIMSEQVIQEVQALSKKGENLVKKLIKANQQLTAVIETGKYKTDDIKLYAQQVQELVSLTKVLTEK